MSKQLKNHKDLDVWKNSMDLVTDVYKLTKEFPAEERYGLSQQLRRSAVSIPSNIAEGAGRKHKKEFIHFLSIALGSLAECETQILIANKLNYMNDIIMFDEKIISIKRMINGLINYLEKK